jgi:hypothetical protein
MLRSNAQECQAHLNNARQRAGLNSGDSEDGVLDRIDECIVPETRPFTLVSLPAVICV